MSLFNVLSSLANIILFFVYTYGLGYALTRFVQALNFEIIIMRVGIGLAAVPVLGVWLNLLGVPLHWTVFLFLAVVFPVTDYIRGRKKQSRVPADLKFTKKVLCLAVIFIFCVVMYCGGAFTYSWLEDDDPWHHAAGTAYIMVEKNLNADSGLFQYINPYPPGYDLVMALMHQTSPSLYWTLKFFNGLIIALGILFFYFFINALTKNSARSLWAAFFLAAVPAYLSHFIWAHSLAVTLFLVGFYCVWKCREDARFFLSAVMVTAGILLVQPTQPVKFMVMLALWYAGMLLIRKKIPLRLVAVPLTAVLISAAWYVPVYQSYRSGQLKLKTTVLNEDVGGAQAVTTIQRRLFNPGTGSTTRKYSMENYLFPPLYNDYNCPMGFGLAVSLLTLLGIGKGLYRLARGDRQEREYYSTMLLWLAFTFLGLNSKTFSLPVGLFAYRFWPLLAVPVCVFAAEGVDCVTTDKSRFHKRKAGFLITAVLLTSAYPKFVVNNDLWDYGISWGSYHEMKGFVWMRRNIRAGSRVFTFVDNKLVIGHDMASDYWTRAYQDSFHDAIELDPDTLYSRLAGNDYEYIVVSERAVKEFGKEVVSKKLAGLKHSPLFTLIHKERHDFWLFKINRPSINEQER